MDSLRSLDKLGFPPMAGPAGDHTQGVTALQQSQKRLFTRLSNAKGDPPLMHGLLRCVEVEVYL